MLSSKHPVYLTQDAGINTDKMLLNALDITLPLTDPVFKFLLILLIILFVPLISERLKVPHLLGLIIAGIIIGPHGMNLITRDSSIILSGTAGMLYIMFLAGLEIDINDFRKNAFKSSALGLYGFIIPMLLGTLSSIYILNFSLFTSILLASMFASHTLITYPIISKLGISKNKAVNISVGSTLITNILALLVLAIIVSMSTGNAGNYFWIRLTLSFIAFVSIILFLFPIIARWFFKRFSDNVSQYIFVLVIVFLGAVLSKFAGIEPIIGAFIAGLALNRLIPGTSPLMNRIDFVGNAIFIPFFLIGVGMLIEYKAFFTSLETFKVAVTMSVIATSGKFFAAWLTQKNFRFSVDERRIIFGLTNAQAAATLAAVLVGYNIIMGYDEITGEPIRLLNDSILNGTIIMVLVTCTIASFITQKGAQRIALANESNIAPSENTERILIPVSNTQTIEELVNLSLMIKSRKNKDGVYALNILNHNDLSDDSGRHGRELLEKAEIAASATDIHLNKLLRFDINLVNGITNVIKEQKITDLILGLHTKKGLTDSFFGNLTEGILVKSNITTFVYKPYQPISTVKRHIVIVPENAEYEIGFSFWLAKVWNIALNTGTRIVFYSSEQTLKLFKDIHTKHPIDAIFNVFGNWDDFLVLSRHIKFNDNIIIILSRRHTPSYQPAMHRIPAYLNRYFQENNFILVFPVQSYAGDKDNLNLTDSSLLETIEKIDILGKTIASIFRRR